MPASTPLLETRTASLEELRGIATVGRLFAVLDACDTPAVPEKCAELGPERAACLYRGDAAENYWAIAPYVVAVDGPVLQWIVAELWDEPWGIFAVADADLETLRRHFRRFLVVRSPEGEQWYFRFYDPRVLNTYLLNANQAELGEIIGPVAGIGVPSSGPEVEMISLRTNAPRVRKIRLA